MSTLTIRLPDSTAERLKSYARSRGQSVNKLVEEAAMKLFEAYQLIGHRSIELFPDDI